MGPISRPGNPGWRTGANAPGRCLGPRNGVAAVCSGLAFGECRYRLKPCALADPAAGALPTGLRLTVTHASNLGADGSRNLVKKGWLARLVGGRYMLLPPEHGPENFGENNPMALAAAAAEPSYIGWWTAAAFHSFMTQKPMTVTVATLHQMPARTIEDTDVRFIKITERKFFGFKPYNVYGRKVAISEPEKTVIDCIDRPDLCGGAAELTRIAHGAMRDADPLKLLSAAQEMKSASLLQRLGYLTDLVGKPFPAEQREVLRTAIAKSQRSIFGRPKRKRRRYRLRVRLGPVRECPPS